MRLVPALVLAVAATTAGAQSTQSDLAAIAKVAAEFSQLYMKGDAAGMAALYTINAAIFPGGRPIIKGREAINGRWLMHLDIWNGSPAPPG